MPRIEYCEFGLWDDFVEWQCLLSQTQPEVGPFGAFTAVRASQPFVWMLDRCIAPGEPDLTFAAGACHSEVNAGSHMGVYSTSVPF
jgi:hypothetical protein